MAWEGSDRRERLPDNWYSLVKQVKERDGGRCTWRLPRSGSRCPKPGTDVDHRIPGDNHDLSNLQLLCGFHHAKKSAQEGVRGRKKPKGRPEERHPGTMA